MGLIRNKASLTKNFHLSPIDVDKMMFWEYEMWMEALNDQIKEENEAQQSEMDKYDVAKYQKMTQNPNKMMSSYKMPSMPKMR